MNGDKKYWGKYRGTVFNNVDPEFRGRIQAMVPDAAGLLPSSWALPCFPFTGKQAGAWMLPQIGAGVWIEFEQGDTDYPIWTGSWFGTTAEVPALALAAPPAVPNIVFQTAGQNTFLLSDLPGPAGGFLLKCRSGPLLMVNDTGITLSDGKGGMITIIGGVVTINQGALLVK